MKTMKKILCFSLTLIALLQFTACGNDENVFDNENIFDLMSQTNFYENSSADHDDSENISEPSKPTEKYESEYMTPYGITTMVKDDFLEFADDDQRMFFTKDGALKSSTELDGTFWFPENADISETLCICNEAAYIDSKGYLHLFDDGDERICNDIKGEIVWYYTSWSSLTIISVDENGYMFYNEIDSTGVKSKDNVPFSLYDLDKKVYYDRVDSIYFVNDGFGSPVVYVEIDGITSYSKIGISVFFHERTYMMITTKDNVPAKDILDYKHFNSQSPLYKKDGDNDAIYYMYSDNELPINMPSGKSVDQLTQAIFGQVIYLIFNDGSIYSGECSYLISGTDMTLDTYLTDLNKSGSIVSIYRSEYSNRGECQIRILMDDNVTYEYVTENSRH